MKTAISCCILLIGFISAHGQISLTADSLVESRWDAAKGKDVPIRRIKENMSVEIDKDLLTLRIFGTTAEMAYIEKAYIIDFLEVNESKDKWLFEGSDKTCTPSTVTLDLKNKKLTFISMGKEEGIDRPLNSTYYTITGVIINSDAILKHLLEKGNRKF
jgi:hypothetical protein